MNNSIYTEKQMYRCLVIDIFSYWYLSYTLIGPMKWLLHPYQIDGIIWFSVICQTCFVNVHLIECLGNMQKKWYGFFGE